MRTLRAAPPPPPPSPSFEPLPSLTRCAPACLPVCVWPCLRKGVPVSRIAVQASTPLLTPQLDTAVGGALPAVLPTPLLLQRLDVVRVLEEMGTSAAVVDKFVDATARMRALTEEGAEDALRAAGLAGRAVLTVLERVSAVSARVYCRLRSPVSLCLCVRLCVCVC